MSNVEEEYEYSGHFWVTGSQIKDDPYFYTDPIPVIGDTRGGFLDNIVDSAIKSAQNAFRWSEHYKPEGYHPSDEHWVSFIFVPATYQIDNRDQRTVLRFPHIALHAVLRRHHQIRRIADALASKSGKSFSEIIAPPALPLDFESLKYLDTSQNPEDYAVIADYGFTGVQLDEIMATADSEGYWTERYWVPK